LKTLFTNATFWSSGSPVFSSMLVENEKIIAVGQKAIEQNNSCYSKNMNSNVPQTQEEMELEKKVYYWQKNKDKITIGGYNKNKWSEY
jgi:hypothetical protein